MLDRTNGKAIVSAEYVKTNWSLGYDEKGQPIPNPAKMPQIDGALVSAEPGRRDQLAAAELQPADRTLLRQRGAARSACSTSTIPSDNPQGWGGTDRGGWSESMLQAIDYKTGKIRWSHRGTAAARVRVLSTAGNVLFTGGLGGLRRAQRDHRRALWHSR